MSMTASRIRSFTSTRQGSGHWVAQRLTALGNALLALWFVWSVTGLSGTAYASKIQWLASPLNATLMVLLVVSVFYHARIGLQVVIEDYVHDHLIKVASLILITFAAIAMATACIISIVSVLIRS